MLYLFSINFGCVKGGKMAVSWACGLKDVTADEEGYLCRAILEIDSVSQKMKRNLVAWGKSPRL